MSSAPFYQAVHFSSVQPQPSHGGPNGFPVPKLTTLSCERLWQWYPAIQHRKVLKPPMISVHNRKNKSYLTDSKYYQFINSLIFMELLYIWLPQFHMLAVRLLTLWQLFDVGIFGLIQTVLSYFLGSEPENCKSALSSRYRLTQQGPVLRFTIHLIWFFT